jgi:hypothetical protein
MFEFFHEQFLCICSTSFMTFVTFFFLLGEEVPDPPPENTPQVVIKKM